MLPGAARDLSAPINGMNEQSLSSSVSISDSDLADSNAQDLTQIQTKDKGQFNVVASQQPVNFELKTIINK